MKELKGSVKQIAWAEDIRAKAMESFANEIERAKQRLAYAKSPKGQVSKLTGAKLPEEKIQQNIKNAEARIKRLESVKTWLENQEEAKMWIDNRNRDVDGLITWAEYKMSK